MSQTIIAKIVQVVRIVYLSVAYITACKIYTFLLLLTLPIIAVQKIMGYNSTVYNKINSWGDNIFAAIGPR